MKDGVTAKHAPIQRSNSPRQLVDDANYWIVRADLAGNSIADAVTKLLERINQLERMAA